MKFLKSHWKAQAEKAIRDELEERAESLPDEFAAGVACAILVLRKT